MQDINRKLEALRELAERPGTVEEGQAARDAIERLLKKYNPVDRNSGHRNKLTPAGMRVFASCIKELNFFGWELFRCVNTFQGPQIIFHNSANEKTEIRVLYRPNEFWKTSENYSAEIINRK